MEWCINNTYLERTFTLVDFSSIVKKIADLTTVCDELNHHPDVCIHGYKHVTFKLFTHDKNQITEKDYTLAKEIDAIFQV